jgi:hypothetical protein
MNRNISLVQADEQSIEHVGDGTWAFAPSVMHLDSVGFALKEFQAIVEHPPRPTRSTVVPFVRKDTVNDAGKPPLVAYLCWIQMFRICRHFSFSQPNSGLLSRSTSSPLFVQRKYSAVARHAFH